jgi:putative solute:sodium symporter small subunit
MAGPISIRCQFNVNPDCRVRAHLIDKHMPSVPPSPNSPAPPPVTAAMARAHRVYWHTNLALISVLMLIGFVVSFGIPLMATRLANVRFAGFPLPFYFGAQGAILVYVALIVVYIVLMQLADARLQRTLARDSAGATIR